MLVLGLSVTVVFGFSATDVGRHPSCMFDYLQIACLCGLLRVIIYSPPVVYMVVARGVQEDMIDRGGGDLSRTITVLAGRLSNTQRPTPADRANKYSSKNTQNMFIVYIKTGFNDHS